MVTERWQVAGNRQDIFHTQNPGIQKVRLKSNPVPIPTGHLENGLKPGFFYQIAGSQ
jgi:hypothetical protein